MNTGPLQTQIDTLQAQLASLQQALQQTQHALEQSRRENTMLRQKLDALARRFFGKKSEPSYEAGAGFDGFGFPDTFTDPEGGLAGSITGGP